MKLIAIFLLILIIGVGLPILIFFIIAKFKKYSFSNFISKNTWLFIILSAIITGAFCQNFFLFSCLCVVTVIAALSTVIGFISDFFTKTNKGIRLTGFIFFFFFFSAATSLLTLEISEQLATTLANKIILSVYDYKKTYGRLPENVDKLKIDKSTINKFKKNQTYLLDSAKQNFQIEAWSDGWNTKTFYSIDSTWQTDD